MMNRTPCLVPFCRRTVGMMIKGVIDPERHGPRLKELEAEEREIKVRLAEAPESGVVTLHPAAIARYRQQLEDLQAAMTAGSEPSEALRALLARVVVMPDYQISIEGHLARLIEMPTRKFAGGGPMVAGERLERSPTFILKAMATPLPQPGIGESPKCRS